MNINDKRSFRRVLRRLENERADAKRERDMCAPRTHRYNHFAGQVAAYDNAIHIVLIELA